MLVTHMQSLRNEIQYLVLSQVLALLRCKKSLATSIILLERHPSLSCLKGRALSCELATRKARTQNLVKGVQVICTVDSEDRDDVMNGCSYQVSVRPAK